MGRGRLRQDWLFLLFRALPERGRTANTETFVGRNSASVKNYFRLTKELLPIDYRKKQYHSNELKPSPPDKNVCTYTVVLITHCVTLDVLLSAALQPPIEYGR